MFFVGFMIYLYQFIYLFIYSNFATSPTIQVNNAVCYHIYVNFFVIVIMFVFDITPFLCFSMLCYALNSVSDYPAKGLKDYSP